MIKDKRLKIITVIGPTSSGKSELAVQLAKRFNGEIVSCDSRQIYRGLNLGTGKVSGKWRIPKIDGRQKLEYFVYKNVTHHCIDFVSPKKQYSVAEFKAIADKAIADILSRGKLPILCGGTMHWIDAVIYNQNIPEVKPNLKLRAMLEKQSADSLYQRLIKLDPVRAKTIDRFNKRRLIRALEIINATGKPVSPLSTIPSASEGSLTEHNKEKRFLSQVHSLGMASYSTLWLGINLPQKTLYQKIDARLKQRIKQGMINEVVQLHKSGLSFRRLESFGLEYKFISQYLQTFSPSSPLAGEARRGVAFEKMFAQLLFAIRHYSKRQMTWWKRNKEIVWIKPDIKKAVQLTKKFVKI